MVMILKFKMKSEIFPNGDMGTLPFFGTAPVPLSDKFVDELIVHIDQVQYYNGKHLTCDLQSSFKINNKLQKISSKLENIKIFTFIL